MTEKSKVNRWLYWAPRVLGILFAVFISIFAFDVFFEEYTVLQMIVVFSIHLVPTFIVVIALLVAWRWEFVGGVLYCGIGIFYTTFAWGKMSWLLFSLFPGVLFLIGILFILNKVFKRS